MSAQQPRPCEGSSLDQLSKDTIFSILSNQRRRYVLYYLHRNPGTVSLRDLAERIASWENDVPVADLEYKQRKRVYTSLHQTHLPKLDEVGVVDYDRDSGSVALADRATDLDGYLAVVGGRDEAWYRYYLALSVVTVSFPVAAWLGVFPFSLLPDLAVAGLIVALFGVTATVHAILVSRGSAGGTDTDIDGSPER